MVFLIFNFCIDLSFKLIINQILIKKLFVNDNFLWCCSIDLSS